MRQQDVFKKVGNILQELNEQYDYLKTQGDGIDDLELELFAANANFLSDHLEVLRKLNAHVVKSLPAHQPERGEAGYNDTQLAYGEPQTAALPQHEQEIQNEPINHFNEYAEEPAVAEPNTISEPFAFENHFHLEQPAEQEPENPTSGFNFDIEPMGTEAYTEPEYQPEPEPVYSFTNAEPPAERAEPILEDPAYGEETETFHAEPQQQVYETEQHVNEDTHEPAAQVDLQPDTGNDHFSFLRSSEPDVIRHELAFSEADSFEESDEQLEPNHEETVAEAMAAIEISPAPIPEPVQTYAAAQKESTEPEKPLTLNERISAQLLGTNTAPAAPQPIKDLKSSITLNDKMLFVRDLFNGYSLAYSEAIEILNRFNNFEDADRFLTTNYVNKNNWAAKPATTEKFYDLLKRRFM